MDNNIVQTVYDTLEARTDEISKTIAERDKLEEKAKSGRYTPQAPAGSLRSSRGLKNAGLAPARSSASSVSG